MKITGLTRPVKTSRVVVGILALVSLCASTLGLVTLRGSVSAADALHQDRQRVWSASVSPGTYEDTNANIAYQRSWTRVNDSNASGGTYAAALQAFSGCSISIQASLAVTGASSFSITTLKGPNYGQASIQVDGQ